MGRPKVQFCPKGHDTFVVGRTDRACNECRRARARISSMVYFKADQEAWNRNTRQRYAKLSTEKKKKFREYEWKRLGITNLNGTPFTVKDYNTLYELQNGRCAIKCCNKPATTLKRGLFADHNHTTKIARALLCSWCNVRLHPIEDKEWFKSALEYLKQYKRRIK